MVINPGQATDLIHLAAIVKGLTAEGVEDTLQDLGEKFGKLNKLSNDLAKAEASLIERETALVSAEKRANELQARADDVARRSDASFADARAKNDEAVKRLKYANDEAAKADEAILLRVAALDKRDAELIEKEYNLANKIAAADALIEEYTGKLAELKKIAG